MLLDVDTVSTDVAGLPLLTVIEEGLSEHPGVGVLAEVILHESATPPAYRSTPVTVMVEVAVFPEVIELGLRVVALTA